MTISTATLVLSPKIFSVFGTLHPKVTFLAAEWRQEKNKLIFKLANTTRILERMSALVLQK